MELVFLKLGGSVITDKTREATPRHDIIRRAAREVELARAKNPNLKLVLGHGSGSFGHAAAKRSGFGKPENWHAFAETGAAAARLNRIVVDEFLAEGAAVMSLPPSASAICRDGELQMLAVDPIRAALGHGLIPLVFGDVAFDETRGMSIISTEQIFSFLASLLHPKRIIYTCAVNGIFSSDPTDDPAADLLSEITPSSFSSIEAGLGGARGGDMTGGMLDKVKRSLTLIQQLRHLDVYVIGADEGLIERALLEENLAEGTWIHAGALAGD